MSEADIARYGDGSEKDFLSTVKLEAELCLGITLSFGLADTKTLAKIGSKLEKPSGAVLISEDSLTHNRIDILKRTDIGSVWGIGRAISQKLTSYNVKTAHDFICLDPSFVKKNFGEGTLATWHELRGEARFETESGPRIPKSLQSTRSFGRAVNAATNTKERSFLLSELSNHAENLCTRLRSHGLKVRRFSFFIKKNTDYNRYIGHEIELGHYTDNASDMIRAIHKAAIDMLDSEPIKRAANFGTGGHGLKFKATGISVHGLRPVETIQDDLFAAQSAIDTRNKYLEAVDSLQKRFGDGSIYLCSSLESKKRRLAAFNERNSRNHFIYGLPLPYMGEVV